MIKPIQAILLVVVIGAMILAVRLYLLPAQTAPAPTALQQPVLNTNAVPEQSKSSGSGTQVNQPDIQVSVAEPTTLAAWRETDQAPTQLATYLPDLVEQGFLELNRPVLESVEINQVLEIWLPQEKQMLDISVDSKEVLASGNTLIKGFLDGDDSYPFVMTLGRTSTFATISTRDAVYSLQGDTAVAWISSSAALKQNASRHGQDFVTPNDF
jgi:hypothetical protein